MPETPNKTNVEIEQHDYHTGYPFTDRFTFEIRKFDGNAAVFVPDIGVFIGGFDDTLTVEQARYILYGYLQGYNKGLSDVKHPETIQMQIARLQTKY